MKVNYKIILCICVISIFFSCSINEKTYLSDLKQSILELDSLRQYIELHHNAEIKDTLNKGIIFVNSRNQKQKYKSYIYDDEVMFRMKRLKIKEIHFEGKDGKTYNEIYFDKEKPFYYPVVSYLYEYDGTTKDFESKTIYYKPVNKHWSLYIDSNFP